MAEPVEDGDAAGSVGALPRPDFVDPDGAVAGIADGATVMLGGWGTCGSPSLLIEALARSGVRDLTVIMCGSLAAEPLNEVGAIARLITSFGSYAGAAPTPPAFAARVAAGELAVELCSQGVLAERVRAGGAGIPAFYLEEAMVGRFRSGDEVRDIGGRRCVLETALRADVALIQASIADRAGNLSWRDGERNVNEVMAFAADVVVAEAHDLYEIGWLAPEQVMVPGIVVDRVVQASEPS
jgi:3-oxoadipate CoA-transferase alpha subunit